MGSVPESEGSPEVMAPFSSIPARRIPWTEEPGGPQSVRSQRQTWLKGLSTQSAQ